jgi:hypothetical protein
MESEEPRRNYWSRLRALKFQLIFFFFASRFMMETINEVTLSLPSSQAFPTMSPPRCGALRSADTMR